jgi:hypothetical protein
MNTHGRRSTYCKGCRCDRCRQANTEYNARVDRRLPANRNLPRIPPRVPYAPLLAKVCAHLDLPAEMLNDGLVAEALGVSPRTIIRWRAIGTLPEQYTDRVAISLGWHPAAIWGLDWYIAGTDFSLPEPERQTA